MRVDIAWGRQQLALEVPADHLLQPARATAAPLPDPVAALRAALEHPHEYPALWRALTPEDHVVIVIDEGLPQLPQLLIVLLEHLAQQAGIQPDAITLLCLPPSSGQAWLDQLPDEFQDVRIEVHQPDDRKKLAYLATTKKGRRVYLNRSAVDADQLVVLSRRRFDPHVGYAGAEMALYPGLSDEATIQEYGTRLESRRPDEHRRPVQDEAHEVAWLLGAPFFVQVIEGAGDTIEHIVAGSLQSASEGERLLNARWRVTTAQPADVVIASVTGDPARQGIDELARAFFAAARAVASNGSIVLLSEITPMLGRGFETFRQHDDPSLALRLLYQEKPDDLPAGFMWLSAANQARLYLLSGLPSDTAEELFTIPLQNAQQAQKLLTAQATCLLLPDAHKTLAVVK